MSCSPGKSPAFDQEAEVTIHVGEEAGILVPLAALVRDKSGRQGVLIVNAGTDRQRTRFQPVQTGASDDRQVLIQKGLAVGDAVVASAVGIAANQRVKPVAPMPTAR